MTSEVEQVSRYEAAGLEDGRHSAPVRIPVSQHRILIGPSCLNEIYEMRWRAAVKHLTKVPGNADPHRIYYDGESILRSLKGNTVSAGLAAAIMRLNADTNCFFLAERERNSLFDGALLASVEISSCARYAWTILEEYQPDLILFHNSPHELFTYVLLNVALHLGIPVILVHYSVLPWRMCISRYSTDGSTAKLRIKESLTAEEQGSVKSYMLRLQATHETAMPFVNLEAISTRTKALHFGEELRAAFKGAIVKNALRMARKWSLYRQFKNFVREDDGRPYVVFLMHYQPEETTIPRGGLYSQQLNAILKLRAMVPLTVNILVKENKAMFRSSLTLAMGVRNEAFYQATTSLQGTYLVPLERDTFDLVDHSLAVATITGSVGMEALCRGKQVIVFGDANYRGYAGVTHVEDLEADPSLLDHLFDGSAHDPGATERDLLTELRHSIGAAVEDNKTNVRSQQLAAVGCFEYLSENLEMLVSGHRRQ